MSTEKDRRFSELVLIHIKKHLNGVFPNVNIYSQKREQALEEPCFLVKIRSSSSDRQLKPQYWYDISLVVTFLPKDGDALDLEVVKEDLLFTFDEVDFIGGAHLRAENNNAEVVDGTVVFTCSFRLLVEKEYKKAEVMEVIESLNSYTDVEDYRKDTEVKPPSWMWPDKESVDYKAAAWPRDNSKREFLKTSCGANDENVDVDLMTNLKNGGIVWHQR